MKNFKRILVTLVAAVLLMAVTVAGTLAWLQSETGPVTNTFTVGNVTITLDEGDVFDLEDQASNDNITDEVLGQHKEDYQTNRVYGNSYKLVPGKTYDKDPIVHVGDTSEDCYVFVQVINTLIAIEAADDTIADQMAEHGWKQLTVDGVEEANVFYYEGALAKDGKSRIAAGTDLTVFEQFHIAANANVSPAPQDVVIRAYAVQAENLASPEAAWKMAPCSWGATNPTP